MIEVAPTATQMKAIRALERTLKQCAKAGVHFHNCYGTLIAYNGAVVQRVDCDQDEPDLDCNEGQTVDGGGYHFDSFADDRHYIHLHERAKGR